MIVHPSGRQLAMTCTSCHTDFETTRWAYIAPPTGPILRAECPQCSHREHEVSDLQQRLLLAHGFVAAPVRPLLPEWVDGGPPTGPAITEDDLIQVGAALAATDDIAGAALTRLRDPRRL